ALAEASMKRIVSGVAATFGAQAELDFRVLFPPTVNDAEQADFAAQICNEVVGEDMVERNPPLIMGSEDFSLMLERRPGCFVNLGGMRENGNFELHNPRFDFNDAILPLGVAFFTRLVETRLSRA
ncbi:MAG: M20/M25/M40 family metallo-hydrolase, partial [Burkholderiaceae bacterium]|nr:M20/M25/M40 family metallo-hydrolase [Burkholderiaceae bacterium]